MTFVDMSRPGKRWLYAVLTCVLLACLWIGWRDFDPWVPQDEVRENIRSTVRWLIQLLVQYAIPGGILIFFGKEVLARLRNSGARPAMRPDNPGLRSGCRLGRRHTA
ncbi:MAG: hypothetical protein GXC76_00015 [Rhodanobacteraceae bacterium]|jgi:hypothetical protein|nr:hypothetical protein [Rhodanobacteraceae bacterium]